MSHEWPGIDYLMSLAKTNPDALEAFRKSEVEKLIQRAPESLQRRLRGLQFQIDCKRQLHRSSMGACLELSRMMQESIQALNNALQGLHPAPKTEPAAVIPLVRAL